MKKFEIIDEGVFDNVNKLTSEELSELLGGCFIDACGVKACGAQVNYTNPYNILTLDLDLAISNADYALVTKLQ